MKLTRVALAAAVVIACVCFLQSAAVPFTQVSHHVESEAPQENEHLTETSQEQTNPNPLYRIYCIKSLHFTICSYLRMLRNFNTGQTQKHITVQRLIYSIKAGLSCII
uniref:Uncharacterized protein n=1 Tax=Sinocyclocheilus rhinocerous TaxID=307959 RepID=A0A673LKV8_9TELE